MTFIFKLYKLKLRYKCHWNGYIEIGWYQKGLYTIQFDL